MIVIKAIKAKCYSNLAATYKNSKKTHLDYLSLNYNQIQFISCKRKTNNKISTMKYIVSIRE